MGIRIVIGAALIAVVAAAGCGSGGESGWGAVIGANEPPVIRHLSIEQDDPEAPGLIRAVAEVREPHADEVDIRYAWEVAGIAQAETGPELRLPHARKGTRVAVTAIAEDARARSEPAVRIIHLRNSRPQPDPVVAGNARPGEAPDADAERRFDSERGFAAAARAFESRSSVTELEVAGDGEALRYAVEIPRTDGASRIRFRLLLGPEGMWVHPASGEVTWLPEPWQSGSHPVEVEVTDASGAVTVEAFSVNAGREEGEPSLPAKLAVP